MYEFSAQKLISCGHGSGCNDNSDIMGNLMKYYIQYNGVTSEKCDPYNADDGTFIESCNENKCQKRNVENFSYKANTTFVKVKDATVDSKNNLIKDNIMKYGSVVGVFPYFDDFVYYKSGIYRSIDSAKQLGVIYLKIYGWRNNSKGEPYWMIENSWGRDWGQNGYMQISFDQSLEYVVILEPKLNNVS